MNSICENTWKLQIIAIYKTSPEFMRNAMISVNIFLSLANDLLRKAYEQSLQPIITLIENRFRRVEIKDSPVKIHQATSDYNITKFMENLR